MIRSAASTPATVTDAVPVEKEAMLIKLQLFNLYADGMELLKVYLVAGILYEALPGC